jgi:hypothetical protein
MDEPVASRDRRIAGSESHRREPFGLGIRGEDRVGGGDGCRADLRATARLSA